MFIGERYSLLDKKDIADSAKFFMMVCSIITAAPALLALGVVASIPSLPWIIKDATTRQIQHTSVSVYETIIQLQKIFHTDCAALQDIILKDLIHNIKFDYITRKNFDSMFSSMSKSSEALINTLLRGDKTEKEKMKKISQYLLQGVENGTLYNQGKALFNIIMNNLIKNLNNARTVVAASLKSCDKESRDQFKKLFPTDNAYLLAKSLYPDLCVYENLAAIPVKRAEARGAIIDVLQRHTLFGTLGTLKDGMHDPLENVRAFLGGSSSTVF